LGAADLYTNGLNFARQAAQACAPWRYPSCGTPGCALR
jgi:hypothetical protein